MKRFCAIVGVVGVVGAAWLVVGCGSTPREAPAPVEPVVVTPEPPPSEPREEGFLARLASRLAAGDFAGALSLFDTLPQEEAREAEMRVLKASVLISAGRLDEARGLLEEVLAADEGNLDARYALARIEGLLGRAKEQRTALEEIIARDGSYVPALNSLGSLSIRANSAASWKKAASLFDKSLESEPGNVEALLGRALVFRHDKNAQAAERLLDEAVSLHPTLTAPLSERARLYRSGGKPEAALADLDSAQKLDPGNYWVAYDRGNVLLDLRRKKDALASFGRAIELNGSNFSPYVYSAGIKLELGDYEGAEKDFASVRRLNPEYFFGAEGVGLLKMRKNESAAARDAFLEAYQYARKVTPIDGEALSAYALLASLNWLRCVSSQAERNAAKTFIDQTLREGQRYLGSLDSAMLRLFSNVAAGRFAGDSDVMRQLDAEKDTKSKARITYYLGAYYALQNNTGLARAYYEKALQFNRVDTIEWRLTEWALEAAGPAKAGASSADGAPASSPEKTRSS